MTFLHPWAIWVGVAAAAVPVLIHVLTRPRPIRLPLSTLRFVREAVRQRRTWRRLRDYILLALRTLAVLLIALAVARPQWGSRRQIADLASGDTVRVVVLDLSQSMAARTGAVELFERARTAAAGYLRYRPGLAADLILAGARPRGVFDGPSTNFDALRDELSRCRVLPQRMDVNRALDLAARMLAPASPEDHRRRELVVVSDFQRSRWSRADFGPLPADTQIQFESTAPAVAPANLAVLRVEGRAAGAQGNVQLEVEVANYSPATRKMAVDVALGHSSWRLSGTCLPGRSTTLVEETGPRPPGWEWGEARLVGVGVDDALAADNVRPFVLQVRPPPRYVLITRQAASRRPTSSLFLECALAPLGGAGVPPAVGGGAGVPPAATETQARRLHHNGDQSPVVVRVDPAALDRPAVAAGDLILLDHPGILPEATIKLLSELMRRGRPILYVAAEVIDATNLKRLSEAAGSGLEMPVEFAPPPAGQARRDLFFTAVRRESPPFAVFGDGLPSLMGRLRFAGGLTSRRAKNGLEADVLATYNDGSAAIVLTSCEAGALAVINADLAASNLPKTSTFVPLLAELIGLLRDRHRAAAAAFCGEPMVIQLPAEAGGAAGLRICGPAGPADLAGGTPAPQAETDAGRYGELADEASGAVWRWDSPAVPGVYRVERDATTAFAVAVNIPAEESRLDSLSAAVLTRRLAAGRPAVYRGLSDEGQRRDDSWKWFATACVACMLGEISALLVFRT